MQEQLFEVLRTAADYSSVLVTTPPRSLPGQNPEAFFFVWSDRCLGHREPHDWHSLGAREAALLYSGVSGRDWGYAPSPGRTFDTLEQVAEWLDKNKTKVA